MPLNSHGSTPSGGWRVHGSSGATFGIELETSRGTSRRAAGIRALAELASPADFWHPEGDSSITGVEFVSHPATLAYWRSLRDSVEAMTSALRAAGAGVEGAGCHVNIGRAAFSSAEHLARFITLIDANPRFSTRMAGRAHREIHWAKFGRTDTVSVTTSWFSGRIPFGDRYYAVNLQNRDRVEFRLPKASLDPDTILAHIEWTAAMVEYTRDAMHPTTAHGFSTWMALNPTDYPAAMARLVQRFPARFDPSHTVPERRTVTSPVRSRTGEAPLSREADALQGDAFCSNDGDYWTCELVAGHLGDHGAPSIQGSSEASRHPYRWSAVSVPTPEHCWSGSTDGYACTDTRGHAGAHHDRNLTRYWGGAYGTRSLTVEQVDAFNRGEAIETADGLMSFQDMSVADYRAEYRQFNRDYSDTTARRSLFCNNHQPSRTGGYVCTRVQGHEGRHAATDVIASLSDTWSR